MHFLKDALGQETNVTQNQLDELFVHYRASDNDATCRKVLLSPKRQGLEPQHVMADIHDRVQYCVIAHLRDLKAKFVKRFKQQIQEFKDAETPLTNKEQNVLKKSLGREFLAEACEYMIQDSTRDKYFPDGKCFKCPGVCCLHPPPSMRKSRRYLNVGGNTCLPWTGMSSTALAWLDDHSIPMIVWLFDLLEHDPDFIIQECTWLFDYVGLHLMLGERFYIQQVIFSPKDLGIPAGRQRSYCLCTNKSRIIVRVPWTLTCLRENFFRKLDATAEIYFRAPDSYVRKFLGRMAEEQNKQIDDDCDVNAVSTDLILPPGVCKLLDEHILSLTLPGIAADTSEIKFACVNIRQTSSFMPATSWVPNMLRKSLVWGQTVQGISGDGKGGVEARVVEGQTFISRLMTPYETLAVQGVPVLLDHKHPFSWILPKVFKFSHFFHKRRGSLSNKDVISLVGNGMHLSQIGLALLFVLIGTGLLGKEEDAELYKTDPEALDSLVKQMEEKSQEEENSQFAWMPKELQEVD